MAKRKVTSKTAGEIGVQAEVSDGKQVRRITLDPLRTGQLSIEVREVETTIPCGFQQAWVDGKTGEGVEFDLNCGAGVGSRWMTFWYKGRYFCVDSEHIVRALVGFAEETATAAAGGAQ